jgi:hypothetical protein
MVGTFLRHLAHTNAVEFRIVSRYTTLAFSMSVCLTQTLNPSVSAMVHPSGGFLHLRTVELIPACTKAPRTFLASSSRRNHATGHRSVFMLDVGTGSALGLRVFNCANKRKT